MLEGPTSFLSQVYEINFDGISIVIFKLTSLRRLNLLNLNSYRHLNSPPDTTRDLGNDLKTQWKEMVLIVKQILLVSTIGDKQRTVCRTCSHFRLSRGQQIRQQFANSREKGDFFIITFWIIKKEFDNSAPAYQGVFFSADVSPTNQITAFLQKWLETVFNLNNEPILHSMS